MDRARIIATLGLLQILAWGSSFYLLGVLGKPIADDTGWPLTGVVGGLSVALLAAGIISPIVGRTVHANGGCRRVSTALSSSDLCIWHILSFRCYAESLEPALHAGLLGRRYSGAKLPKAPDWDRSLHEVFIRGPSALGTCRYNSALARWFQATFC